jgi:hypothetical protein
MNISRIEAVLRDLQRKRDELRDAEIHRHKLNNKTGVVRVSVGDDQYFTVDVTQYMHWSGTGKVIEGRDMIYLGLQKLANARIDLLKEKVAEMEDEIRRLTQ